MIYARPFTFGFVSTILLGCAANPPPPDATVLAADPVVQPLSNPIGGPATVKLDRLSRSEFNRLAAELALPVFWREDTDGSKTPDPAEINGLWGVRSKPPVYVTKGAFTQDFYQSYDRMAAAKANGYGFESLTPAERSRREAVLLELSQGRPSLVHFDFRTAPEEDRAVVEHVLNAALLVERIFAKQQGSFGMDGEVPADDTMSRMMLYRNQDPWCQAPKSEKDPNCTALARRPAKISGLYPSRIQQDPKFCEALEARKDQKTLLTPFTAVIEQNGDLKAVPYNEVYKQEMDGISRELHAAAEAIQSPSEAAFKAYLEAAAKSFTTNVWEPADEAWAKMNATNSKWFLRIAPDEVYFEPCSHKAGFHVSFARINPDSLKWQEKLDPVKTEMEGELAKLTGAPYVARTVTFHLPDFIDIVINAGDSRAPIGATIGQSLPNWGPVANEGRGRTVVMNNLYTDKDSLDALKEQAETLLCPATMKTVSFAPEASTMSTVLHEASHNLGPSHEYAVAGKTAGEVFGGPLASTLEELKAQTSAFYFTQWLVDKKLIDPSAAVASDARNVVWAFGHVAQGMYTPENKPKPYSQLASIQLGSLLSASALKWNAKDVAANGKDQGCFEIVREKFPGAVSSLEKKVLSIKGKGDKFAAVRLKQEFVDNEGEWKKLRAVIQERWTRTPKSTFVYSVEY